MKKEHINNLDYFLKVFYENEEYFSQSFFRDYSKDFEPKYFRAIIDKLVKDGYVKKIISKKEGDSKTKPPYFIRITFDGILFLENGAYKELKRVHQRKKLIDFLTVFVLVINSILVLFVSIAGVYVNYTDNIKEKRIYELEQKIEQLKKNK